MANENQAADAAAKQKADAEAKPKADAPAAVDKAPSTDGLVKMSKDGAVLFVHPTTVKDHETAGWAKA